jgi:CheY-like chemotaxis protein
MVADPQSPALTVLVIEDNAIAREGLVVVLRHHGYAPITAADGSIALSLLAEGVFPDLILLDMVLPIVDGWQFLDLFRAGPLAPTPVILTTGTGLSRNWAEAHGCAGILHKPFDEEDFIAEIRRVLRPARRAAVQRAPQMVCTHTPVTSEVPWA